MRRARCEGGELGPPARNSSQGRHTRYCAGIELHEIHAEQDEIVVGGNRQLCICGKGAEIVRIVGGKTGGECVLVGGLGVRPRLLLLLYVQKFLYIRNSRK